MQNKALQYFLIAFGWLSVVLGVIGIVVPLLPTTPFILLAAGCFAKASPRFHRWILNHHFFGPLIIGFQNGQGIPLKIKYRVIAFIWITLFISMIVLASQWITLVLLTMGIGLTIFLWRVPTDNETAK